MCIDLRGDTILVECHLFIYSTVVFSDVPSFNIPLAYSL